MATMTQAAPPAGARIRKTTETEILPPREFSASDAQPSPFYAREWETVVNALTPEQWTGHVMRVYRSDEKWERGSSPVDNTFTAAFTEEDIRARFGGGKYLLWLYGPPKRQTLVGRYQLSLDGQPILNGTPRNGQSSGSDTVAIEAMRMYANPQFMQFQMDVMRQSMVTALELVKNQNQSNQSPLQTLRDAKEILGVGGPSPMDEIYKTLMTALVQKLLNPPETNSFDATLELVNKIKTAGLFGGAPKADLASTFAANIPMLADRLVAGLAEYRKSAEATERTIRLQRGEMNPGDPNVITQTPTPQAASVQGGAAPSTSQVTPEVAQAIIAQSHLHRLVAGIKQPNSTGQDMYDYLVNAWPEVLGELCKMSKEMLLSFFKSRELQNQYFGTDILAEVGDDPRLPKMIEDFLAIAKQDAAEIAEAEKVATAAVV